MSRRRFNRRLAALGNRNLYSFAFLFLLGGFCTLIYYFGELVDFAGWEALRWDFFYSVHDVQRLLFLAPITYAGYVFGTRAAIIVTILTAGTMLFRAIDISPFPDPILRPAIFCIIAGAVGYLTAIVRLDSEKHKRFEVLLKSERDTLLDVLERLEDGVFITGPDYKIRFTNPSIVREFGEGMGSYCHKYLHGFDKPCSRNCRLFSVINGKIGRWEYAFPHGITYDVLASPYVDSDGVVCQLSIFRNTARNNKANRDIKTPGLDS